MTRHIAQGRRLIAFLKRRPMTYLQMQQLGISTSPQKRVVECLLEGESIRKTKGADGLVRWSVVRAAQPVSIS